MKTYFEIILSFLLLTACTVPSPSDFESRERPMAKDEFIAMWRFPSEAYPNESLNTSEEHAADLEAAMAPFFQQIIPRIFTDAKNGKLEIMEAEDVSDLHETVIEDLNGKMNERFTVNWQDLSAYMHAIHITQRRKTNAKGFPANELEIMIIENHPNKIMPERYFGAVRVADLHNLNYEIEAYGNKYDVSTYLNKYLKFGYPIFFKSHKFEAGLQSLKEAFAVKKILLEGKWEELEWLGNQPNLSGMKLMNLPKSRLLQLAGTYSFEAGESYLLKSLEPISIQVKADQNHLHFDWPTPGRFSTYNLYPSSDMEFFSPNPNGYLISFTKGEDGKMQMTILDRNGLRSNGIRE